MREPFIRGHFGNSLQENVDWIVVDPDEWVLPYGQFKEMLLGFNLAVKVYFGPNLYKYF